MLEQSFQLKDKPELTCRNEHEFHIFKGLKNYRV